MPLRRYALSALLAAPVADVIAVRGNPLTDVTTLERVEFVMLGGRRVQ